MVIVNGDSIVDKARSFAKVLASSRAFQEFYSARGKFEQDKEAQSLLEQFQRKQREFQEARIRRTVFSGDAVAEVQRLQGKLQSNSTIMQWARAQQDAIELIQIANEIISEAAGFDFGQNSSAGGPC